MNDDHVLTHEEKIKVDQLEAILGRDLVRYYREGKKVTLSIGEFSPKIINAFILRYKGNGWSDVSLSPRGLTFTP